MNSFKTCNCCGHEFTKAEWDALPSKGVKIDEEYRLEFKDCFCGSTLATEEKI